MRKVLVLPILIVVFMFSGCGDSSSSSPSINLPVSVCTLSSQLVAFGTVPLGTTATKEITISCLEPAKLSLMVTIGDGYAYKIPTSQWEIDVTTPNTAVPITIEYTPAAAVATSGYIQIKNNTRIEVYDVVTTGTGKKADAPTTKTVSILDPIMFDQYQFGYVTNNTSKTVIIKLVNNTGSTVKIDSLHFTTSAYGDALSAIFTTPTELESRKSIDVEVTYKPTVKYSSSIGGIDLKYTMDNVPQQSFSVLITGSEGTF